MGVLRSPKVANFSVAFDTCKCYYSPCFHQMGLVRAETVDLYRGGLPINPLPARKGKTFDRPWHNVRWKEELRNPDKDRSNVRIS
jgi:hypothetical protein